MAIKKARDTAGKKGKTTNGMNPNVLEDKFAALRALMPEVFVEGKLDPALLRALFKKECVEGEGKEALAGTTEGERYGLSWAGKRFIFDEIAKQSVCTLTLDQKRTIPKGSLKEGENVRAKGIPSQKVSGESETRLSDNLFIEGENLEVLRTLQKAYHNKVKMIYIDPPYNTGKDFVYHDNFRQTEEEYCDECNVTAAGHLEKALKLNSRDGGRFHSNWLNMIYPRLFLARNLLRDDGVIFVSIDDNEVHNLRMVMNEIFGEENVEQYVWNLSDFEESSFTKTASNTVRKEHEYILAAFKQNMSLGRYTEYRFSQRDDFSNPDNDPRGDWMSGNISRNGITSTTGSKYFTITTPTGTEYTRNWTVSNEEFDELLADNRIHFSREGDGVPRLKIFKNEPSRSIQSSIFSSLKTSITGKNEIKELLDDKIVFDFPKPTKLIRRLLEISTLDNDIILDFFAGSGTTAHAVMAQNIADGGNRTYICVQMPEETPVGSEARKAGYERVSEIAVERITRASAKLRAEHPDFAGDLGVRVYKATDSHFPQWQTKVYESNEELEQAMIDYVSAKPAGTPRERADEVLLKLGYPLTTPLEDMSGWYRAGGALALVLDETFKAKDLMSVLDTKPTTVIVLEQIFKKDEEKINFDLRCNERKIIFDTI